MSSSATSSPYARYRFPAEVISQAVWLYFRFPLSLRMVEEMLAARGGTVKLLAMRLTKRQAEGDSGAEFRPRQQPR